MSKGGNRHEFLRDSKSVIGRSVVYLLIDFVCLSLFLTETAQVVVFIRSVSICGVKQLQALTDIENTIS